MALAARPQTPLQDAYMIPIPNDPGALGRKYGGRSSSRPSSYVASSAALPYGHDQSQFAQSPRDFDTASRRSSAVPDSPGGLQRSASQLSQAKSPTPSRSGTLKKKASLSKKPSLRRNSSRRSLRAGSVKSLSLGDREKYHTDGTEDINSAFMVPIPTNGNPTDALANRFQAWRKVLKDLIIFFKEVQKSYETRSKLFLSASHVVNSQSMPPAFLKSGGLADATEILREFHRQGYTEANKAAEVEIEVISQLTGLRSDLQKKTKEIKSLSGDFKNTVDKELEDTRKAVRNLEDVLGLVDTDPSATSGKGDPFIMRLNVQRQVEKQIEEENYLHRAYLNLEKSGRDLESIVVSEIQKAYNAYASILSREADEVSDTVEKLRVGPLSMPHDHEWNAFVANTDELVDPRIPERNVENITYPGKDHLAAAEVRAGMLERKSKYLKSYTPGWYVLSPTHLHEFKSADRVEWQTPVMSLYLPEQKLGSHSQPDSSSHKFMLKGRQTGPMHRGHSWVFRAESHETMMSWYEDIESLINKTGEARNAFVRRHVRSVSGMSATSDGVLDDDEADHTPYSAESVVQAQERPTSAPRQPGGAFPSDVQIDRQMQAPLSPSSGGSSGDHHVLATGSLPDGTTVFDVTPQRVRDAQADDSPTVNGAPRETSRPRMSRHDSYYGDWIGPVAKQKQAPVEPERADDREILSHGDASLAAAGVIRATERRDHRESVSTVPTNTNVTDWTNHTGATSVDGAQEPVMAGVAESEKPSEFEDGSLAADQVLSNGANIEPGSMRSQRDSVACIDMKIPGNFPPANVAA